MSNYTAEERAAWTQCVNTIGASIYANQSTGAAVGEAGFFVAIAMSFADAMLAARRERFGVETSTNEVSVTLSRNEVNHLLHALNVAEYHDDFGDGEQGRKRHPFVVSKLVWCAEENRRKAAK